MIILALIAVFILAIMMLAIMVGDKTPVPQTLIFATCCCVVYYHLFG